MSTSLSKQILMSFGFVLTNCDKALLAPRIYFKINHPIVEADRRTAEFEPRTPDRLIRPASRYVGPAPEGMTLKAVAG